MSVEFCREQIVNNIRIFTDTSYQCNVGRSIAFAACEIQSINAVDRGIPDGAVWRLLQADDASGHVVKQFHRRVEIASFIDLDVFDCSSGKIANEHVTCIQLLRKVRCPVDEPADDGCTLPVVRIREHWIVMNVAAARALEVGIIAVSLARRPAKVLACFAHVHHVNVLCGCSWIITANFKDEKPVQHWINMCLPSVADAPCPTRRVSFFAAVVVAAAAAAAV